MILKTCIFQTINFIVEKRSQVFFIDYFNILRLIGDIVKLNEPC